MIDVSEIGRQIGEQVAKEPGICWYPGGFKPPHKGHWAAAKQLASKPYITQVDVLIGHGVRDGITAEQSKAIWDEYLKTEPNPKIKVQIAKNNSPIKDIYSWFADDLTRKAYVAAAGKEVTDLKYFDGLKNAFGDRVQEEIIDDEFVDQDNERVSGSEFRATLNRLKETYRLLQQQEKGTKEYVKDLNDYNTTYNYLKSLFPESVVNKGKFDDILKILRMNFPPPTSLQELKDRIPGGLAKGKSLQDIAKKHNVTIDRIKRELKNGIKVELEHTTSKDIAAEIARDHVWEKLDYYEKLAKYVEKGMDEGQQPNPKNQPNWVWLEEYKNKNKFNPAIFETDDKLDPKVKELLLKIATYFWETLETNQPFDDVTLTGSSANYNYTPYSDIDLHIIVDFNKFKEPEMMKKFFDNAKNNWNNNHDLKLGKQPIEVYVQDSNEKHTSTGVYSVMNDKWIKKPEYEAVNIPDGNIKRKSKPFKEKINSLIISGKSNPESTLKQIEKIQERLKNFRQAGLDKNGEYSLENLAFKDLRNTGYLDKLSQLKNELIDKKLSLSESIQDPSIFDNFFKYACQELQIQSPPTLEVKYEFGEEQPSFGAYVPSDHHIFLNPSNRNIVDVFRTLAHELVHAKQNELGILTPTSGETGSEHENDANSIAGILMRDYGKSNPDIYTIGVLNESETKKTITCDKCGWTWKKTEGGKDMYVCHQCGWDNTSIKLNEVKEERPKITRIYFDLDGVLAGFDEQFRKYNKEGLDFKDYIKEYGANEAWDIINKGKEAYWADMPWNPGGKQLYDYVMKMAPKKGIEVWILSSPGNDPNGDAKRGKNKWVIKHLNIPESNRVYKKASEKHTEAKEGYLLIDDMGRNVSEFINAGGYGIKNNPENSMDSIKKLHKFGL